MTIHLVQRQLYSHRRGQRMTEVTHRKRRGNDGLQSEMLISSNHFTGVRGGGLEEGQRSNPQAGVGAAVDRQTLTSSVPPRASPWSQGSFLNSPDERDSSPSLNTQASGLSTALPGSMENRPLGSRSDMRPGFHLHATDATPAWKLRFTARSCPDRAVMLLSRSAHDRPDKHRARGEAWRLTQPVRSGPRRD
ncbi:hypothetical protein AAFF_G00162790 [Aldrovandia affinis]|uniref:Uncharacterized protein n=1 Tax=Aldrovandia affinis TaxID=143900 RepID=A0AAD7T172_9TELE|nr:hypothetical protein AAFF_G00162790 [Aldrovandia affinis]